MRIAFFGTPDFAIPTLNALAREHEIALVVAQPDRPSGRGMKTHAPAVAVRAKELGLSLAQPARVREVIDTVAELKPEVAIVIAYGKILPASLLAIPKHGFLNVHASVLPSYRGAAPIQRAIEHGESETGVTIMRVDEELDHGPILSIARTPVGADEHSPSLAARLARLGAEELLSVLRDIPAGTPQDHARATQAPKIEKHEGEISWTEPAETIYNKFRAFDPWPGVFSGDLKFLDMKRDPRNAPPRTIIEIDREGVVVAAGDGAIRLIAVQRAAKSRQPAAEFAHGAGWRVGDPLR